MDDPGVQLDEVIVRLREQGYRLTPQRMAVLKVLEANEHPSVQEIYERVKADFPMISLATIYSAMALLKDMGEVVELGFGDGRNRYDGSKPYPHPHLICVECEKIVDLEIGSLDRVPQEVMRQTGYKIMNYRLDFFGICPQCQGGQ